MLMLLHKTISGRLQKSAYIYFSAKILPFIDLGVLFKKKGGKSENIIKGERNLNHLYA